MNAANRDKMRFSQKQATLINALRTNQYSYLLFGGGAGGAKTFLGAFLMLQYAIAYPKSQIGVFRRNLPTLKRTTLRTFNLVAESMNLKKDRDFKENRTDLTWELTNGSMIFFMDLDERIDPDFNRVKGLELSCAFIDEANEIIEDGFTILKTRVGRRNQHGGKAFIYLTCNPDQNWVKTTFYDPWKANELPSDTYYLQALATDNPYLPKSYVDDLKKLHSAWRKRFLEGDWDYADEDMTLFKMRYLDAAMTYPSEDTKRSQRRVGIDVAREGGDKSVFALLDEGIVTDLYLPRISKDTTDPILVMLANEVELYVKRKDVPWANVTIDTVGVGAGVYDILRSRGYGVRGFKAGERAADYTKYFDRRSEAYCLYAEKMESGSRGISRGIKNLNDLRQDLIAHKLQVSDKLIRVESKSDMRKRLKRSPDFSDAVIIADYEAGRGQVYVPEAPKFSVPSF